jgi:hypothetical protein
MPSSSSERRRPPRGGARGRIARQARVRAHRAALLQDAPPPPARAGAAAPLYGRKIDRDALLDALEAASREHRQNALALLRARPDFDSATVRP